MEHNKKSERRKFTYRTFCKRVVQLKSAHNLPNGVLYIRGKQELRVIVKTHHLLKDKNREHGCPRPEGVRHIQNDLHSSLEDINCRLQHPIYHYVLKENVFV